MKSHLKLIPTNEMTDAQWLNFRYSGIGGSEVGAIMGLSPYRSSLEVFYNKIGDDSRTNIESLPMLLGTEQEPFIAKLWSHWDGTKEGMIANYRAGKVVRRYKRVNAYIINPKYPWLFVSLDFEINKTKEADNGALETKTINSWAAKRFTAGFPPEYVTQVQTQITVGEYPFGEAAVLQDNSEFFVLPFEPNKSIQDAIIETTHSFWQRVTKARELMTKRFEAERTFNYRQVQELTAELQSIEPEPDGSEAYNSFMKEKYRIAEPGERKGTKSELEAAEAHKVYSEQIKILEEKKQLHENRLKASMRDTCDKLDFGKNGYVSWKADAKGSRRFNNKVKA